MKNSGWMLMLCVCLYGCAPSPQKRAVQALLDQDAFIAGQTINAPVSEGSDDNIFSTLSIARKGITMGYKYCDSMEAYDFRDVPPDVVSAYKQYLYCVRQEITDLERCVTLSGAFSITWQIFTQGEGSINTQARMLHNAKIESQAHFYTCAKKYGVCRRLGADH